MTKTYPIVQLGEYLYALDKKAEIKEGDSVHSTLYGIGKIVRDYGGSDANNNRPLIAKFLNSETLQSYHRDGTWQRGKYEDVSAHTANKIIATTDKSLNLPLLPEIEEDEEIYKLANEAMQGGKGLPDGLKEYRGKAVDFAFDKYIEGYKAAREKGKYSEEDMLFAAKYGYDFHKETQFSSGGFEEVCKNNFLQALESLSPAPIKVEIEMEDVLDHMDMKIGEEPKTKDNVVIVKQWIYE